MESGINMARYRKAYHESGMGRRHDVIEHNLKRIQTLKQQKNLLLLRLSTYGSSNRMLSDPYAIKRIEFQIESIDNLIFDLEMLNERLEVERQGLRKRRGDYSLQDVRDMYFELKKKLGRIPSTLDWMRYTRLNIASLLSPKHSFSHQYKLRGYSALLYKIDSNKQEVDYYLAHKGWGAGAHSEEYKRFREENPEVVAKATAEAKAEREERHKEKREEILESFKKILAGRNTIPTYPEGLKLLGVNGSLIQKLFGGYNQLILAAGESPPRKNAKKFSFDIPT